MKPPEGYRELKVGEKIRGNDLAFQNSYNKFTFERDLGKGLDNTGDSYVPNGHFRTFRKIDDKEEEIIYSNSNEYRFFLHRGEKVIFASNNNGGHYVNTYSDCRHITFSAESNIKLMESLVNEHLYTEINLDELNKFFKLNSLNYFFNELGIPQIKIEFSENERDEIINHLKNVRAFNEDSAFALKNPQKGYILVDEGRIKNWMHKFYLENV